MYEVVGIRAEAGSLRPNQGVAAQGSLSLVVFRAKHGRCRLTVLFAALGSQCVPIVTLSVAMLSRSNTPCFEDALAFDPFLLKNKQHATGIR